jgi:hypothetical protein
MHFGTKSYVKSNRNHTAKQTQRRREGDVFLIFLQKSHLNT